MHRPADDRRLEKGAGIQAGDSATEIQRLEVACLRLGIDRHRSVQRHPWEIGQAHIVPLIEAGGMRPDENADCRQ